jgi:cytidine deaminase
MQDISSLSPADQELVEIAKKHAKERWLEKRSSFGAALRARSGQVYTGINLKYQAKGCSMCAARVAIFKAVDEGVQDFDTLVEVKYEPEDDSYTIMNSCGECRQVFTYYAPFEEIVDDNGTLKKVSVSELLPYSYV